MAQVANKTTPRMGALEVVRRTVVEGVPIAKMVDLRREAAVVKGGGGGGGMWH